MPLLQAARRRLIEAGAPRRAGEAERASRRLARIKATAAASSLAALVRLTVSLVAVRVSLSYLGSDQYGLWMTVAALAAVLAAADFGMGNGLLNAVADADGRRALEAARSATSSALFLLSALAALLALVFWAAYPFVPWGSVLNASAPGLARMSGPVVAITVTCALVGLPLGTTQQVQLGYQEGFVNGLWNAAGSLLGLAALLLAIEVRAPLPWLVLALTGAPLMAQVANGWSLFAWRRPALRPRWTLVSRATASRLLGSGSMFFAIQAAGAVGYQVPTLVIAGLLGAADVTQFAVPFRLFTVMPTLTGFFLVPLWPAFREALARGDARWVRRAVGVSATACLAAHAAWGAALLVYGPTVLRWWVGPRVVAPFALRLALALWVTAAGLNGPLAMFLNSAAALRFQAICSWLMALASVGLCFLLVPVLGAAGAAYAMVVAQVGAIVMPSVYYVPRLLRRLVAATAAAPADASPDDGRGPAGEMAPSCEGAW